MNEYAAPALPVLLLAAGGLGWWVQGLLADTHRSRETVDAVRLVLSMLVTFVALVLGLLTTSAKGHFDRHVDDFQLYSIDLITLDEQLREFGPPAGPARAVLRAYMAAAIADTWPDETPPAGDYPRHPRVAQVGSIESAELGRMLLEVDRQIANLAPADALQRQLSPELAARIADVLQQRRTLISSSRPTLAWPFMAVMILWLLLVFAIFGVTAPANRLVFGVIVLGAVSVSAAVWLIVELDAPSSGVLVVSPAPMQDALAHMDAP